MKKLRLWLSYQFCKFCLPSMDKRVLDQIEWEMTHRRHLTNDIHAAIRDYLDDRIPVESTTHSLAVHVRERVTDLERKVRDLDRRFTELNELAEPVWRANAAKRLYGKPPVDYDPINPHD